MSGRLGLLLDGATRILESRGATFEIPRGVAHTYWNADPAQSLQLMVTVAPAHEAERLWKTAFGLGHDYGSPEQVKGHSWCGNTLLGANGHHGFDWSICR